MWEKVQERVGGPFSFTVQWGQYIGLVTFLEDRGVWHAQSWHVSDPNARTFDMADFDTAKEAMSAIVEFLGGGR